MPSFVWEDMAITHDISMRDRLLDLVDRQLDKDFAEWETGSSRSPWPD